MKHLVTAAFLIAAIVCYATGVASGMVVFTAAALVLEAVFWFRLFKQRQGA